MTIWRAQIDHMTLCFYSRAEQLCFEMNDYGRSFHHGKSIEKDMRSLIIDDILSGGMLLLYKSTHAGFSTRVTSPFLFRLSQFLA